MPVNEFTSFIINAKRRITCFEICKSKNRKDPFVKVVLRFL